ncbi:MAG TPA: ABC transporter permease [Candidatus Choladousia intestinigallinarum]|nr:ABC transporter permease [Candidatus Choladousia intestinigallinarum]
MEQIKTKGEITGKRILKSFLKENIGILVVLCLLVLILSFGTEVFATKDNILSVLRQVFTNLCLAIGMTFVIIAGGIDLSGGAVVALSGIVSVALITQGGIPIPAAILAGLLLGLMIGALNGLIISTWKVPAFIVTMATMNIIRGAAQVYTGGTGIRIQSVKAFTNLGVGRLAGVPYQIYFSVILIVLFSVLLGKTKFGMYVYALGGNREAARLSGIPLKKIEIIVYTISGFLAAMAGIILAARMYSAQPSVGDGAEMDAIAACVLGGISMQGGVGRMSGTIIGVLVIGVINNGLNLMNVNAFWQLIAKGAIILLAIYIDTIKARKRENN